ncbi:MAG: hypothetical protein HGA85_01610 [Nanoarchaeota archaeon]|nr:hypothetical protein [Nanoarchaeota archaeon]
MKKIDRVVESVKKIWKEKTPVDHPSVYHKYINELDRDILLKAANKLGTPQYVLNQDELIKRAIFFKETFTGYIPNVEFFYATKCNDLPFLVKTLKVTGFNADVAGMFELKLALKLGFKKIIFTGPGKSEEELKLVIKKNRQVILNIDNMDELDRLIALLKESKTRRKIKISFRVNPDSTVTKVWSKFGIDIKHLKDAVTKVKKNQNLKLVGLHFHSSWNKTPERYMKKIKLLGDYLRKNMQAETKKLEFLDIGGGFYPEDVASLAKTSNKGGIANIVQEFAEDLNPKMKLDFNQYKFKINKVVPLEHFAREISTQLFLYIYPLNKKIKIYMEPGRFLVTHSTSILLKVIATKPNAVIVDGGINLLGDYRFEEYAYAPIVNLSQPSLNIKRKTIYGPLCDPSDLWGFSYFGAGIKKGDVLAVLHQGAYSFACAWRFIKPTAKYVAITGDQVAIVKEEEKFQDRYSGCRL